MMNNIKDRNGSNGLLDTMTEYASFLTGVIYNIVGDREATKDVLQNTYIKAVRAIQQGHYHEEDRPRAWLARIAKNESISYLRDRYVLHKVNNDSVVQQLSERLVDDGCPFDVGIDYSDIQRTIAKVIAKQGETIQHIFRLFFLDGQKMEDIAAILDQSSGTVRSVIYRMRHRIIPDGLREAGYAENDFKPWL